MPGSLGIDQPKRREFITCRRRCCAAPRPLRAEIGRVIMPAFSPELIQIMRAVLEEVMTKVPLEQRTPGIKAHLAECILKAAAQGETSYGGLIAAAAGQLQTVLSMFS